MLKVSTSGTEKERKFTMSRFPDTEDLDREINLKQLSEQRAEQSYICYGDVEVRLRKKEPVEDKNKMYSETIKDNGDIEREENRIYITEDQYKTLLQSVHGEPITKRYRRYAMQDGHVLEVSLVDEGKATEFMYGEIEFDTVQEALDFDIYTLGDMVEKDVTFDKEWKMKNYWKRTRVER